MISLALVSAVEGISLELVRGDGSRAAIARARAVIASLVAVVAAHPDEMPQ